jgi:hypothetical protein
MCGLVVATGIGTTSGIHFLFSTREGVGMRSGLILIGLLLNNSCLNLKRGSNCL